MKTSSKLTVVPLEIPEVKKIVTKRFGDPRGFFEETYNQKEFQSEGITLTFVQDNHSLSEPKGTIRGLHYQLPPYAQDKLIRVLRGAILDVAVDLRKGSPTFGKHVAVTLTSKEPEQLLVPIGFAHGFCTLESGTEVTYKVTNFYSAAKERGILWNDPALGIHWPVSSREATVSDKDRQWPLLEKQSDLL